MSALISELRETWTEYISSTGGEDFSDCGSVVDELLVVVHEGLIC